MDGLLAGLTALTALGCGVVAGVFFAFSTFVMRALRRVPPAQGIVAMQAINDAAIPSVFLLSGSITALGCVALTGWALAVWSEPFAPLLVAAGIIYVVGVVIVTAAVHLPRNDALATVDPQDAGAADHWSTYLPGWTAWNHVRTATALVASALLTGALLVYY